jgi:hypothetical protein
MKGPGKISVTPRVWWDSRTVELRRKEFVMSDEVRTPDEDEVEAHGAVEGSVEGAVEGAVEAHDDDDSDDVEAHGVVEGVVEGTVEGTVE